MAADEDEPIFTPLDALIYAAKTRNAPLESLAVPERFIFRDELKLSTLKRLLDTYELHFTLENLRTLSTTKAALNRHIGIEKENVEQWVTVLFNKLEEK
jgi:hypothetical protein